MNEGPAEASMPPGLISLSRAIESALAVGAQRGERVFVVGGVVRDLLMKRTVGDHDLDLVVEGDAPQFARDLSGVIGGAVKVHKAFLTAKLSAPFSSSDGEAPFLDEVDVATARSERYERPGSLPSVTPTSIERDLWRRDFSINAMALPLAVYADHLRGRVGEAEVPTHLVDPCGGYLALRAGTLGILHPSSFVDDPTRLFRAVRYCVRLAFELDAGTSNAFHEAVQSGTLATISPRRVWNEVVTSFDEAHPYETIRACVARGLFSHFAVVHSHSLPRLGEAIERLMTFRSHVEPEIFADAAKLVLVAIAPDDERASLVKSTQENKGILTRAQDAVHVRESYVDTSTLLAAFALHGAPRLLEALRASLGVSVA